MPEHKPPSDDGPDFDRLIPVHTAPIHSTIKRKISDELRSRGIYAAPPPINAQGEVQRPVMPPALSMLTPIQTLDLLGQYGAYLEYISAAVADYAAEYDAWSRTKSALVAQLRPSLTGSPQRIKDAVENDPRYRDVDEREFAAKTAFTMSSAIEKGAENSRATISRAITSQGQELERGSREHNVAAPRRGYMPSTPSNTPNRLIRS